MKNFLFFTLVLLSLSAHAQFTKDTRVLGGEIDFALANQTANSNSAYTQKSTTIHPSFLFGKFASSTVLKSFGIDYQYNYLHSNFNNPSSEELDHSHSIGVFFSHMKLMPLTKNFYFTATGRFGGSYIFGQARYPGFTPPEIDKLDGFTVDISGRIGLLYHVNKRFFLTADLNNLLQLSYRHTDTHVNTTSTGSFDVRQDILSFSTGFSDIGVSAISVGVKMLMK